MSKASIAKEQLFKEKTMSNNVAMGALRRDNQQQYNKLLVDNYNRELARFQPESPELNKFIPLSPKAIIKQKERTILQIPQKDHEQIPNLYQLNTARDLNEIQDDKYHAKQGHNKVPDDAFANVFTTIQDKTNQIEQQKNSDLWNKNNYNKVASKNDYLMKQINQNMTDDSVELNEQHSLDNTWSPIQIPSYKMKCGSLRQMNYLPIEVLNKDQKELDVIIEKLSQSSDLMSYGINFSSHQRQQSEPTIQEMPPPCSPQIQQDVRTQIPSLFLPELKHIHSVPKNQLSFNQDIVKRRKDDRGIHTMESFQHMRSNLRRSNTMMTRNQSSQLIERRLIEIEKAKRVSNKDFKPYMGEVPLQMFDQIAPVLLIDDNIFNLTSLQSMISVKFGIHSTICNSGRIAIKFLEQRILLTKNEQSKIAQDNVSNKAVQSELAAAPVHIIFMDCNMPDLNGFETTRKVIQLCKQQNTCVPLIVALTANADVKELRDLCYQTGHKKFVQKPIQSVKLAELFTEVGLEYEIISLGSDDDI